MSPKPIVLSSAMAVLLGLGLALACHSTPARTNPGVGGAAAQGGAAGAGGVGGLDAGALASGSGKSDAASKEQDAGGALADAGHVGSAASCTNPTVRITEIDVGATVVQNEDEAGLKPLAIASIPSGGSRVAWFGGDGRIHVTTLASDDTIDPAGAVVSIPGVDYADLYADAQGGVLLLSRAAAGGGTLNCGNPANLCGTAPLPPIACNDMYMVRFDAGTETWATQLTQGSAAHPPYLNGKTDPNNVIFIWWYAHHGRIAFDGSNYAGYFGAAVSVSESGCVNIHQGDELKVVSPTGALLPGHDSFDWGCSHSGYERVLWDPTTQHFVTVCKNDAPTAGQSGKLALAPSATPIYPVDLYYSDVGNLVLGKTGGYWLTTSAARAGQPPNQDGLADVHLLHFTSGAPDTDLTLASDPQQNDRAPHLTRYGDAHLLAAWDSSTAAGELTPQSPARQLHIQVLDASDGSARSAPIDVAVRNNRYQEMKPFPDGSVAYAAPGSSPSKIEVLRVLPCH